MYDETENRPAKSMTPSSRTAHMLTLFAISDRYCDFIDPLESELFMIIPVWCFVKGRGPPSGGLLFQAEAVYSW